MASPIELVEDGFLDPNSNYTAFVEVIVPNNEAGRSPYMVPRKPGEAVFHNRNLIKDLKFKHHLVLSFTLTSD